MSGLQLQSTQAVVCVEIHPVKELFIRELCCHYCASRRTIREHRSFAYRLGKTF